MFNLLPLFSNELHPLYQHTEYHEGVTLQRCRVFCNSYTNTQRERLNLLGVGLTSMACRPCSTMFIQKQSFSISACFSLHSQTMEFHMFQPFLNKPNSEWSWDERHYATMSFFWHLEINIQRVNLVFVWIYYLKTFL